MDATTEAPAQLFETIPAAADRTGLPKRYIRYLVEQRRIPFYQPTSRIFLRRDELDRFLAQSRVEAS